MAGCSLSDLYIVDNSPEVENVMLFSSLGEAKCVHVTGDLYISPVSHVAKARIFRKINNSPFDPFKNCHHKENRNLFNRLTPLWTGALIAIDEAVVYYFTGVDEGRSLSIVKFKGYK